MTLGLIRVASGIRDLCWSDQTARCARWRGHPAAAADAWLCDEHARSEWPAAFPDGIPRVTWSGPEARTPVRVRGLR